MPIVAKVQQGFGKSPVLLSEEGQRWFYYVPAHVNVPVLFSLHDSFSVSVSTHGSFKSQKVA